MSNLISCRMNPVEFLYISFYNYPFNYPYLKKYMTSECTMDMSKQVHGIRTVLRAALTALRWEPVKWIKAVQLIIWSVWVCGLSTRALHQSRQQRLWSLKTSQRWNLCTLQPPSHHTTFQCLFWNSLIWLCKPVMDLNVFQVLKQRRKICGY